MALKAETHQQSKCTGVTAEASHESESLLLPMAPPQKTERARGLRGLERDSLQTWQDSGTHGCLTRPKRSALILTHGTEVVTTPYEEPLSPSLWLLAGQPHPSGWPHGWVHRQGSGGHTLFKRIQGLPHRERNNSKLHVPGRSFENGCGSLERSAQPQ